MSKDFKQNSIEGVSYISYTDTDKQFKLYRVLDSSGGAYTFYSKEVAKKVAAELAMRHAVKVEIEIITPLDVHPHWERPPT